MPFVKDNKQGKHTYDAFLIAEEVPEGQSGYAKGEKVIGQAKKYQDQKFEPSSGNNIITIPAGYHDGSSYVDINNRITETKQGNATADNVLINKTFTNSTTVNETGTMPDRSGWYDETEKDESVIIPEGYHDGTGYVSGAKSYSDGRKLGDSEGYDRGKSEGIAEARKGDAIAENVLEGKTFTNKNNSDITGAMPDKTGFSQIITPSTSQQEILIPKGFHDGTGKITVGAGLDTSDATATASNILTGATAYVNNVKITGTMPNQASWSQTVTPSSAAQSIVIPAGYHNGSGKIDVGAASTGDIYPKDTIRDASEISKLITDSSETVYDGHETRYFKSIQVEPNQPIILICNEQSGSYYSMYYYNNIFQNIAGVGAIYLDYGYSQSVSPYTYYYNAIIFVKADSTGLIKWLSEVTTRNSSDVRTSHFGPVTIKTIVKF